MSKKTVTERTPSLPELQSLKPEQAAEAVAAFRDQYPDLHTEFGKVVAKGRFSAVSGQVQNIPRDAVNKQAEFYAAAASSGRFPANGENTTNIPGSALFNIDYAQIEQRVTAMHPALGAPYGQEDKTYD